MEALEKTLKLGLLYTFWFLNAIDLVQTFYFVKAGIEGNPFVVSDPNLWFILKTLFTFGIPIGLYRFDLYLEEKEDEGFFSFMKSLVRILYVTILLADIFYLSLVLTNIRILGSLVP